MENSSFKAQYLQEASRGLSKRIDECRTKIELLDMKEKKSNKNILTLLAAWLKNTMLVK